MHKSLSYRPEIDGLRTVAVLAVILFHLDANLLKGGFLGVDVFFVISGYLITSIIVGQLRQGTFSFFRFWMRRIRRLYPALVVVVAVSLLIGAFILVQPERANLPKQAQAAILSYQNIHLWLTTGGYWSPTAENILLLHTWSLSLEEQFYVIFPLILFAVFRWGRERKFWILGALLLASLAFCIYATPLWRNASFYLLPMRMWELMFGSLLAIRHLDKPEPSGLKAAPFLQIVGLALIIGSFFMIKNDASFPGYLPLFPCIGTLLILSYGNTSGWVNSFLSLKPVVYIGKISYSLYLWHWVVIVTARYVSTEAHYFLIPVVTLACAMASYHFIEQPFRYGLKRPWVTVPLTGAAAAACVLPIWMLPKSPLLDNLGNINKRESRLVGREFSALDQLRRGEAGVWVNEREQVDICLIGSSHARVWGTPIGAYAKENDLSMVSMSLSRLGFLSLDESVPNISMVPDGDVIHRHRIAKAIELRPRMIILGGRWSAEMSSRRPNYMEEFMGQVAMLSECSETVVILGEAPCIDMPDRYYHGIRKFLVAKSLSNSLDDIYARQRPKDANIRIKSALAEANLPNVIFIDPEPAFVNEDGRLTVYDGDVVLYYDDNHLNIAGTQRGFDAMVREPLNRFFTKPVVTQPSQP